jgi:hypothetical protein
MAAPKVRQSIVVIATNTAQSNTHHGGLCNGVVAYSMKEEILIEGEQMKLEVTKQNEEHARRISTGKRLGVWLKEMVNPQSKLEDLKQQQQPESLVMTHELNGFCREKLLISKKRSDYGRIAC